MSYIIKIIFLFLENLLCRHPILEDVGKCLVDEPITPEEEVFALLHQMNLIKKENLSAKSVANVVIRH
jgi:hypothetical protein